MPDIIFTRTYLSPRQMYGALSFAAPSEPSLGLCYLAAVARKAGYSVEIIDSIPLGIDNKKLAETILKKKPKYVGLSSVTLSIHKTAELAGLIKKANSKIVTIIGGVHVTAMPLETMRDFKDFDIAVLGEGEDTIIELLAILDKKADPGNIDGLALRHGDDIKLTRPRAFIRDLDRLPMPAWDLLPSLSEHYKAPAWTLNFEPSGLLILSRGCSAKCTYCDRGTFGNTVRAHSAEYAMGLIKDLYDNHGIRIFRILDDNFMMNRARLVKLCGYIIESKLDIKWTCFARADHVNSETLDLMYRSGCRQISFGVETGSQDLHNLEKKNISLVSIERGIRLTKRAGMRTIGFTMIGHPGETKKTIRETIDFCKKLKLDDFKMLYLTPYPATEIYRNADNFGILNRDFRSMNAYLKPCFVPFGLTEKEVIRYRKSAYMEFYLRPKIIGSHLSVLKNPKQLFVLLKGAFGLMRMAVTR